ncbi:ABC transporter ATP-binding protein [Staphylococcus succinus]|uniref:Lantibiotic ABC transporter ATP-binding protein n=1 Tax=Staphylococcus succinus TaxID=61015 RepID=A0ABX5IMS5_9STAP|nr:ATP-binding cassette domain-containing protein [Staphylococcus succinus]PTI68443.1 lantibiotic ABC transporter ATP-binding protein [Staphylococcus succinus]
MEILSMENINKKIKRKYVLKDITFSLEEGHIIGLVGGNGAGKTTLMKVILGLSNYQSGTFKKNISTTHNDIGALIEAPGLYPFLTGYENMKLIDEDPDNKHIDLIVEQLKMEDFIHSKAKTYSLGMKQKLGIALAFLNHPKLVILDEPMNGLDPRAVKDVREAIISLREQGVTFLISSHILSELVKVTDSLLIIDKGEIVRETTMEQLHQTGESDLENVLLNIIEGKEEA